MKILIVNNAYPSARQPASATYIQTMEDCLTEAGYEVDRLVLNTDFSGWPSKFFRYVEFNLRALTKSYSDYDWVYIHHFAFALPAFVLRFSSMKKVVLHWHGNEIYPHRIWGQRLNNLSFRFVSPRFKHMAPSRFFAGLIAQKINLDPKEIFVTPSGGIDTGLFKPSTRPRWKKGQKLVLGYSGMLANLKGIHLIIQLLEKAEELKQKIGGDFELKYIFYGPDKETFSQLASRFPEAVQLAPFRKSEMPLFYQQVDILLFPTNFESLGLVGIEAMSCNVPVVGTDGYGVKEYLEPGVAGEVFKENDFPAFFDAICRCVDNYDSYQPRLPVLSNYSRQAVIEGYKSFFG